jgi:hypothetical protein
MLCRTNTAAVTQNTVILHMLCMRAALVRKKPKIYCFRRPPLSTLVVFESAAARKVDISRLPLGANFSDVPRAGLVGTAA